MQRFTPLPNHLQAHLCTSRHRFQWGRHSRPIRLNLNTLPGSSIVIQKLLKLNDDILHGYNDPSSNHFFVELRGGDRGLGYVRADRVECYTFCFEVGAVGAREPHDAVFGCRVDGDCWYAVETTDTCYAYDWVLVSIPLHISLVM